MATNPQMLVAIFDAIFTPGGKSMFNGETLQTQIALAGERTWYKPLLKGWSKPGGGTYDTSPAQQLVYMTQALTRIEAQQGAIMSVLSQIAEAANKGVAVDIDYDRIRSMMPTYELVATAQEGAK